MRKRSKTKFFISLFFIPVILTAAVIIFFYANGYILLIPSAVLSETRADFDGRGERTVIIRRALFQFGGPPGCDYGDRLFIFESLPERPFGLYKYEYKIPMNESKPLKLMSGDINGDGAPELSVVVYKKVMFDPVMKKRPFFFNLRGGDLFPVWLGSRFARPFEDYILWDDGSGELRPLALEYSDGGMTLALYEWDGFGFALIARSDTYGEIKFARSYTPGIIEAEDCRGGFFLLYYDGSDKLIGSDDRY